MKKSKLAEKPSRIPDISEQDITRKFEEYIAQTKTQNTESAKAQRFLILLKDVFGDVNAGFVEIEKIDGIVRGLLKVLR